MITASSAAGVSLPFTPRSAARISTTGMPLSMQVTSTPSMRSRASPVGSSAPQLDPRMSEKRSSTGAPWPGTPLMAVSPL
jgi:hypothetical protein